MPNQTPEGFTLSDQFRFRPWPIWDPAPIWLLGELERGELIKLALISVEMQQEVLNAQLKASTAVRNVLSAVQKG